jgi:hypothetical protein
VVASEPDDLDHVGQLAEQGQHLPVVLLEPAKVERVEDIAVENEPPGVGAPAVQVVQEVCEQAGLAVAAAEVQV